jgi:hypothetical protein
VITLRSSLGAAGGGACASAVPQEKQNLAWSGFWVPHSVQNGMRKAYAREGAAF